MATNQCPNSVVAGEDSTPVKLENEANQPIPLEGDSTLHIADTIGMDCQYGRRAQFRPLNSTIRHCIGANCILAAHVVQDRLPAAA
jgi:hypothetical protein